MPDASLSPAPGPLNWLIEDLKPQRLLPILVSALVVAVINLFVLISFAAVIFSGPLSGQIGLGIGIFLVNSGLMCILMGVFSSTAGQVLTIQDSPVAIFAVIATSLLASMPASASPLDQTLTVIGAMMLGTLLTGLFFVALGVFNLGGLIRFVPHSVTGGFLAGTGWLLLIGGIGLAIDLPQGLLESLRTLTQIEDLVRWLPALLFGLAMVWITRRFRHFLVTPAMMIGFMLIFYLGLFASGLSLDQAIGQGLMLGPFATGSSLWQPLVFDALRQADWPLMIGQIANFGSILFVSAVSLLLNVNGIELVTGRETNTNQDLRTVGFLNILIAALGGGVGYVALSLTALGYRLKAASRLVPILVGLLFLIPLLAGPALLTLFPRMVLGGVLVFLGAGWLMEWVIDAWFSMDKADYAVVLLILITIAVVGFLPGVAVGIVAAVVLFVINYSRTDMVKHSLTLVSRHSNFERPREQRDLLRQRGDRAVLLELQGYIFFGTADQLLVRVNKRLNDPALTRLKYLLLDFRLVTGLDSSAVASFSKLRQLGVREGFMLAFTGLSPQLTKPLTQNGFALVKDESFNNLPDMDHGLEWIENRILNEDRSTLLPVKMKIETQLKNMVGQGIDSKKLVGYFTRREVKAGDVIGQQGEFASELFIVESGQCQVTLKSESGSHLRLRTIGPGSLVGDMGLYLGVSRTATISVDVNSVIYTLSAPALAQMEKNDPDLAMEFHKFVLRLNAERLNDLTHTVEMLLG